MADKAHALEAKVKTKLAPVGAKIMGIEHRLVADGACCAKFPSYFGAYHKQLLGCMKHHHLSEDEKTGLLWFKQADKGCGGFGSAHHCFVAWLSVAVWLEVCIGIAFFVFGLLEDGIAITAEVCVSDGRGGQMCAEGVTDRVAPIDILISSAIKLCWCYIWNYVGYWALETKNNVWSIVYLVLELLNAIALLMYALASFSFAEYAILFVITGIGYLLSAFSAFHIVIFGSIALSKLHHGGSNKSTAREVHTGGGDVESA